MAPLYLMKERNTMKLSDKILEPRLFMGALRTEVPFIHKSIALAIDKNSEQWETLLEEAVCPIEQTIMLTDKYAARTVLDPEARSLRVINVIYAENGRAIPPAMVDSACEDYLAALES